MVASTPETQAVAEAFVADMSTMYKPFNGSDVFPDTFPAVLKVSLRQTLCDALNEPQLVEALFRTFMCLVLSTSWYA